MLNINLLEFQDSLKLKSLENHRYIFDPIRKKYLVLQPEEFVRQLLIQYLIKEKGYKSNWMSIEKGIQIFEMQKRFDLLVYDRYNQPKILVECKAPEVAISQDTFEQIAWYNLPLHVPFGLVTNGRDSYCFSIDYDNKSYQFEKEIPSFEQ